MNFTMRAFLYLLGSYGVMAGESWWTWRVVLIGLMGERLDAQESDRFREVSGVDASASAAVSLFAAFVGRRGGKDTAAAVLFLFLALCRRWNLAAGEVGMVLVVAVDRDQCQVAFRRVLGILEAVPPLTGELASTTREAITLRNGIEIRVATADGASVRGRTLVAAGMDEFAFIPAETAVELLRALRPATATTPGSIIAIISTIYTAEGPAFELFRQWGQVAVGQLVVKGTSRDFNPTLPEEFVARELALDPQGASAEYLTIPRTDRQRLFDAGLIDSAERTEPRELPRRLTDPHGATSPPAYFAGLDVSGGRGDAAACAIAHRDAERIVIDAVRFWPAPHDPLSVAREVAAFMAGYGLRSAIADQFAAEFATSAYREAGVTLAPATVTRSEAYLHALPLFTTCRIEIPYEPRLRRELLGLERRTGRNGRDSVDHPPHGHDDVANAVALAALAARRRSADFTELVIVQSRAMEGYFHEPLGDFIQ